MGAIGLIFFSVYLRNFDQPLSCILTADYSVDVLPVLDPVENPIEPGLFLVERDSDAVPDALDFAKDHGYQDR